MIIRESLNRLSLKPLAVILIFLFLVSSSFSRNRSKNDTNEKLNINDAVENLSNKLSTLSQNGRPVRVAVVPFSSAFKQANDDNKFGEYFAERSITAIKNAGQQIKLFERKRLDAITKEHALNLSGLINQDDAVKIGELVPIDYLLTGTYSKLESYIEINGRVLDVVSGEIVQTFIQKVNLTNELASLFPKKQQQTVITQTIVTNGKPEETKPACYNDYLQLKELYKSESNEDLRIKKMVEIALTIPVNRECGEYHEYFIEYLRKLKEYPSDYVNYLYNEVLNYKENPDECSLIYVVLRYFKSDGLISDKEWQLGLSVLKKSDSITRSLYTANLFVAPDKSNIAIQKKRVDELAKLIIDGTVKAGQPVSIDNGLLHLFNAVSVKEGLSDLQILLFDKYSNHISNKRYGKDFYDKTVSIFKKENDLKKKQLLIKWMGQLSGFVENKTPNTFNLLHLLEELTEKADKSPQDSLILSLFIKEMKPSMKNLFPLINKSGNAYEIIIQLCIKNNIIIDGYTPTLDELRIMLASENNNKIREAAKFVKAYGKNAKPIEKDIARLLRRSENLSFSGATNLQWDLLKILENTKPTDPEIIKTIFKLYSSRRHEVPKTAMEVMASLGNIAYPILTSDFNTYEPSIQIRIIKTLAQMKDQKKMVIPFIKGVYKTAKNTSLKDSSEDALIRLGAL